jgi:hypothetical protein
MMENLIQSLELSGVDFLELFGVYFKDYQKKFDIFTGIVIIFNFL